jgi:hypothetical protein
MAERPVDKLLPQSLALVAGVAAIAVAGAGVAADFVIGRPSSTAALGIVVMFPLALFAAIVGFAIGHFAGFLLRKAHLTPALPMKPYRIGMALGLAAVAVTGAAAGARPVIRHERLHQPRVIAGADRMDRLPGAPDTCSSLQHAPVACDLLTGQTSSTLPWNGRQVTLACTRDGLVTISDQSNGVIATADLRPFEYVRQVQAASARQRNGREALVVLARLRATGRREMLVIFNADGQVRYQELIATSRHIEQPLSICRGDDVDSPVVDAGSPITYRER